MSNPLGRTPLGRSLLLRDGDLVLADGRLIEVSGAANLLQALTLRVLTPFGDDRFNTGYGFDAADVFTRATTLRGTRDLMQLNLVRTLGTDPRVQDIRSVVFLDPPEAARHRAWPVVVTLVTVDGAQQQLTLRGELGG
jgi:hypothetical protein